MTSIRAIETEYAGCRFRSRLEARFAVAFDHDRIEWQYEPEGFETPAGRYLPDFRLLTDIGHGHPIPIWIEVKHEYVALGPRDQERYWGVATGTGSPLIILFGLEDGALFLTPDNQLFERPGHAPFLTAQAVQAAKFARFERGGPR